MPGRFVWKIASPMIGLSIFLLGLGAFAAWNVHKQQRTSSDLVMREVHGILAIEELHMTMREIRYQLNMFLRSRDSQHLHNVASMHITTDQLLARAKSLARTERETELIGVVDAGYQQFFAEFQTLAGPLFEGSDAPSSRNLVDLDAERSTALTRLSDVEITNRVLQPLRECLYENQQAVDRTNEASQATSQHVKIGFLLLGLCGCAAGLGLGAVIARGLGRSIVQLNISVRGVAGRLSDVTGPVTFSHLSDLAGVESGLRRLEGDIASVVQRLQQREMEVLRSEQLARVGQLAAGLAHELRNPLMPMKVLVQAAIERGDSAGLKGRSLQVINDEIARMEQSIQAFLDFARPPTPEKSPTEIKDVIRGTIELMSGRARQQSVVVRTRMPDQAIVARVDRTQLRQLILNLLLNALDVLPSGGKIDVRLDPGVASPQEWGGVDSRRETPTDGQEITEHDALRVLGSARFDPTDAKWFAIRVLDNGPGIPPESLESIFEPFVTTKETGTGLGLSVCQRIALAHHGQISASNRPSGGCEFVVILPYDG